ncbi:hypothetical protein JOD57_004052 [Geodermatophilus bullaregiensis]|nr:hypothetical protein [Geodermatophilus bullaregiensis]
MQRLADGEVAGEAAGLQQDAEVRPDPGALGDGVRAEDVDRASVGGGSAFDQFQHGGRADAVDAQEREDLPGMDGGGDAADGLGGAVPAVEVDDLHGEVAIH